MPGLKLHGGALTPEHISQCAVERQTEAMARGISFVAKAPNAAERIVASPGAKRLKDFMLAVVSVTADGFLAKAHQSAAESLADLMQPGFFDGGEVEDNAPQVHA